MTHVVGGKSSWRRTYPDVVPSVKSLDEEELELMSEALEVHKDWGYSKELPGLVN